MFATRTIRMEWELLKWLAILALAATLAMFWAMRTAAAALPEPALLPEGIQAARPMPTAVDPNVKLWQVIELQQAGQPEEALVMWNEVQLPHETEVWQHLAMGVAHLQLGQLDEAAEKLMLAEDLDPQNPVVHYYLGLLRLDQARQAHEWYDAIGPAIRFAAHRPHLVAPNTRGMYELVAMQELETAIANAYALDRGAILMLHNQTATLTLIPATAHDLMVALGCDQFAGQAHNVLGAMYLDRGATDAAEEHMDAAAEAGMAVVFGYEDLGAAYEQQGRHADAARVYLKGIEHAPGVVRPVQKALQNFGKALFD